MLPKEHLIPTIPRFIERAWRYVPTIVILGLRLDLGLPTGVYDERVYKIIRIQTFRPPSPEMV